MEGFKGTYTVGVSDKADYASIGDAVNAMKDGIDGPVVFELENGTYNEVVNIAEIKEHLLSTPLPLSRKAVVTVM